MININTMPMSSATMDFVASQIRWSEDDVLLVRVHDDAKLPEKKHSHDAGVDLYNIDEHPKETLPQSVIHDHYEAFHEPARAVVKKFHAFDTGWRIMVPSSFRGGLWIASRSGLALEGVFVANAPGIIDPGYTGPLKCIMASLAEREIFAGERIAQLVTPRDKRMSLHVIDDASSDEAMALAETLSSTRGYAGFGSTGTR